MMSFALALRVKRKVMTAASLVAVDERPIYITASFILKVNVFEPLPCRSPNNVQFHVKTPYPNKRITMSEDAHTRQCRHPFEFDIVRSDPSSY